MSRRIRAGHLACHPARQLSLLDLGCGTGLLAVHLGRLKGRLIGADLYPKMLEQARRREIYDDLELPTCMTCSPDRPPPRGT